MTCPIIVEFGLKEGIKCDILEKSRKCFTCLKGDAMTLRLKHPTNKNTLKYLYAFTYISYIVIIFQLKNFFTLNHFQSNHLI